MAELILRREDGTMISIRSNVKENLTEEDVFLRSDFVAAKLWTDEDIVVKLEEYGYEGSEENVSIVLKNLDTSVLEDCQDFEWDCITDAILNSNNLKM